MTRGLCGRSMKKRRERSEMAYLKIYCDYCGQTWQVYRRSMNDEHSRECPHCGSKIDSQTWSRQVVPALCMVSDANGELMKDHLGYHVPVFTFDVISDHYFSKKKIKAIKEGR